MSTLKVNTLTDTAATKSVPIEDVVNGTARAWVNFDGSGTVAIRAQYNVSSITDNGVGNYTVVFTNALLDENYVMCGSHRGNATTSSSSVSIYPGSVPTTGSIQIYVTNVSASSFAASDSVYINVAIFR